MHQKDTPRKINIIPIIGIGLIIVTVLIVITLTLSQSSKNKQSKSPVSDETKQVEVKRKLWKNAKNVKLKEKNAVQIKNDYSKAVVMIFIYDVQGEAIGLGSGFIVTENGLIVTNYHVIKDAYIILVKLLNGEIYKDVSVKEYDIIKDIAILKIKGQNLPTVILGNSDNIEVGEKVYVIGNPVGLENTISDGLLSGMRDTGYGYKLQQISAPVSPGSSGSPVFNSKGAVVGIVRSLIVDGQNLNFSIPINYVMGMISEKP